MKRLLFLILFYLISNKETKSQVNASPFIGNYICTLVQYYGTIDVYQNHVVTLSAMSQINFFEGYDGTTLDYNPYKLLPDSTFYDTSGANSTCRYGHFYGVDSIYIYSCSTQGYWSQYYGKKDTSVSINEPNIVELNIYPNPATNKVRINANASILIKDEYLIVRNSIGETVVKEVIELPQKELDISSLKNGIYFVEVKTKKGIISKKLAINK